MSRHRHSAAPVGPQARAPVVMMVLVVLAGRAALAQEVSSNQDLVEKFSCEGRAAGFYADIPSGCQMYHNCDEAGRVFTHTCPERTLFQQRTMVCDHWYMVECSGAAPPPPAAPPRPRPSARRSPPLQVQAAPAGGADPARKRHSQRVVATFPYQRGNESTNQNSNVRSSNSQDRLESFKISSNSQEKLESFKISSSPQDKLESFKISSSPQDKLESFKISSSPQEKLESFKISSSPQEKLESFKISSSPQEKLESFKISSLPSTTPRSFDPVTPSTIVSSPPHIAFSSTPPNVFSSTPRSSVIVSSPRPFVSSAARIERVERPIGTFVPIIPFHSVEQNREREFRNLNRPIPTVGRAKIERVFKESVLGSPGSAVVSQVQYISPFREPKAEFQFPSTTPRTTSQATPSFIENKYNNNPYFESYFRTSYAFESTTTSKPVQTTTRSYVRQEEEDISENKVELVIPDPRKMFYIPESNYDPGESAKEGGTVLVIELPGKNSMKFQRVGVTEARNHDCPQCHPSFLLPGLCRPCVLIR
ncbi:hypothetical protein R5R35_011595 [Gryllus longicercus]|uniref:Chitin-binding type-2 domain-containing protein n=1 Tax=Gryllus longicercus TaxID=2509291 RepID=A0AAN9VFK0_9ORTH